MRSATGSTRRVYPLDGVRALGRPDSSGSFAWYPFGGEITSYHTFEGLTIPSGGRLGWCFGTDRWPAGEFFCYQITELHLVTAPGPAAHR